MDSAEDAYKQCEAGPSNRLLRNEHQFCENPFCLGTFWHEWGCCSVDSTVIDSLLSEALSEDKNSTLLPEEAPMRMSEHSRYALPKTDEEIKRAREESVPKTTRTDTAYCIRLWNDWAENRNKHTNETVPPFDQLHDKGILQCWLTRFILEVRSKKGTEYTPNTLHHIVCGIMRHLRQNCGKYEIDFFKDPEFADFRASLDAEMKRLQSAGVGSIKKQAEPLTMEDEEILWKRKLLGDHSPEALLNTMVYMNGLYFALRSGSEHRQLRHNPCQIQVIENPGERPYLRYTEDTSKNHPGGLKGRKQRQKVVVHHSNVDNPTRCFVRLFKLYKQLCPVDRPSHAFYLAPLKKPTKDCWFSHTPLGHNMLKNYVGNMCKKADIKGYKTNHSLRATAATRLYLNGVDEQLVMERTGHRSIEGIRSYKRTSREQQENVSDLLNGKKPCIDVAKTSTHLHPLVQRETNSFQNPPLMFSLPQGTSVPLAPSVSMPGTSHPQSLTTNICAPQSSTASTDHTGVFYLHSCSNVTINFNHNPKT